MRQLVLFLLFAGMSCGGSEPKTTSASSTSAPRKVSFQHDEGAGGPKRLSKDELAALGIEHAPSKVHHRTEVGPRQAQARSVCDEPVRGVRLGRPVAVPLAHPLIGSSFSIDACVVGRRRVPLRYIVDSGADGSSIDQAVAARGGLEITQQRGHVVDANGVRERLRTVEPTVLQFTDLEIANAQLSLSRGHALLGQDVLNEFQSWMLDHDAGLVRLGMRPPSQGFLTRAPLKKVGSWPGNYIQVRIAGRTFVLKLDTGAFSTSISREVAESLRLPKRKGRPSAEVTGGVHSRTIVGASYEADIEIGGLVFEDVEIMPLPAPPRRLINRVTVAGLLGADVLLRHNIVVRPHKDISFYERSSTRESASARIARWSWVPMCEGKPGCVALTKNGRSVTLAIEQDYPQAAEFLFACVNRRGEVQEQQPYLLITDPQPRKGQSKLMLGQGGARAKACAQFALVDVQAPEPGRTRRAQRFVAGARHWLR